jgi:membrane-bound inhibitor of C-type lysozyme
MMRENAIDAMICSGLVACLGLGAATPAFAQNGETQLMECRALADMGGKQEPSEGAGKLISSAGTERTVERGALYYTSDFNDRSLKGWLGMYGAQNGHGSSFVGYYPASRFACTMLETVAEASSAGNTSEMLANMVSYACDDGLKMTVLYEEATEGDRVRLLFGEVLIIDLPIAISGSGARYSNGIIDWHTKGSEGLLTQDGRQTLCKET